jgi:hypothetical protein
VDVRGDLKARVQGQFFQNVVDVTFDRIRGDVEPLCNVLVAQAIGDQPDDFPLAVRHANGVEHLGHAMINRVMRDVG